MTPWARLRLLARRLAAYGVDVLVLMVALAAAQLVLWLSGANWARAGAEAGTLSPRALQAWVALTVTLPSVVYFAAGPVLSRGTPGHALLGLKAVGRPGLGWGRALMRALLMLVPFEVNHIGLFHGGVATGPPQPVFWIALAATYLLLGLLVVSCLLDREGRGLHDRIGGLAIEMRR